MIGLFVMTGYLWSSLTLLQTWAEGQPDKAGQSFHLAVVGQPIAGISYKEALKIYDRHADELRQLPGAVSVGFFAEGLVVETANPAALPAAVEGLPVFATPPIDPRAAAGIGDITPAPPSPAAEPLPLPDRPAVDPSSRPCLTGTFRAPGEGRCQYINPPPPPKETETTVELVPPPPGIIVLKPGKVREQAETCPIGSKERATYNHWRFCLTPGPSDEDIPPLWMPLVAGVPYEEALEILDRHDDELIKLPGVTSVGLSGDGIHVSTSNPAVVPSEVEGLPIKVDPPEVIVPAGHTFNTPVRPLHGASAIYSYTIANGGTLTGVALSAGHPWLIFPAHIINGCAPTQCAINGTPLNQCPHYNTPGQRIMVQPPSDASATVGYAQRWTPLINNAVTTDVAAAYMDSDTVEGNAAGNLAANRKVESDTGPINFLGIWGAPPPPNTNPARIRASIGPPHEFTLTVKAANQTIPNISMCGNLVTLTNQTRYTSNGPAFSFGDSGSPIFNDLDGVLIGMFNWCVSIIDPSSGQAICTGDGGGTNAQAIFDTLKFDRWYGTETVKDNTIGAFHPSTHQWTLDNGNGKVDACNPTTSKNKDACLGLLGSTGEYPVIGNWTGPGQYQGGVWNIGVFSPPINGWILDTNGNGNTDLPCTYGTGDCCAFLSMSQSTDLPIVGDWNGDGRIKLGQFRPSIAQWFLDLNGNMQWDGCAIDRCLTFGSAGDQPVAGDWNGNGITKIGVFRDGNWRLDYNGNGTWDSTGDVTVMNYGGPGDVPVVGDWSGTGRSKIGVFQRYNGQGLWFLDGNGSNTFTGCADDICWAFGSATDLPVVYKKSVVRAN